MIRKSIEHGTKVFHLDHGIGTFNKWSCRFDNCALVEFDDGNYVVERENLTEFVDEEKQKQEFDPPV